MNLKQRVKTYSFWVSLASAIFLILRVVGEHFGFSVNENLFSEIFTALCSILVLLGIIVPPKAKNQDSTEEKTQELLQNSTLNNMEENMEEIETDEIEIDDALLEAMEKPATKIILHCLETIKCVIGENLNRIEELEQIKNLIDGEIDKCKALEEKTQNCDVFNEKAYQNPQIDEKINDTDHSAETGHVATEKAEGGDLADVAGDLTGSAEHKIEEVQNLKSELAGQVEIEEVQNPKSELAEQDETGREQCEIGEVQGDLTVTAKQSEVQAVQGEQPTLDLERALDFVSDEPFASDSVDTFFNNEQLCAADRAGSKIEADLNASTHVTADTGCDCGTCRESSAANADLTMSESASAKERANTKRLFCERTLARLSRSRIK